MSLSDRCNLHVFLGLTFAEDAADGEIREESEEAQADNVEDGKVGHSPDAQVTFLFTEPTTIEQCKYIFDIFLLHIYIGHCSS